MKPLNSLHPGCLCYSWVMSAFALRPCFLGSSRGFSTGRGLRPRDSEELSSCFPSTTLD